MKNLRIGTSGIYASAVAQGVMRMAEKSVDEAVRVVDTALNGGINFFDTADCYTNGESSRKFGAALKELNVDRDSIYIQSKVGIVTAEETQTYTRYDFSRERILERVDFELKNLGVDYLDALLLHRPDTLMEPEEIDEAFNELLATGKVRYFGVSNMTPWQVEYLQSELDIKLHINQLQFSIEHSGMADQNIFANMTDARSVDRDGGILEYSRLRKMTIQAWSPLQAGFFGGTFIDNPEFAALNEELERVASHHATSKNAIAIAWILRHPAHMQAIIGSMNEQRIAQFVEGASVDIDRQEWWDIYAAAGNIIP